MTAAVRVRRGETWRCGDHVVRCGDATDADAVAELCGGERPQLLLTDPPYGVAVGDRNKGARSGVQKSLANDDLDAAGMKRLWGGRSVRPPRSWRTTRRSACSPPRGH